VSEVHLRPSRLSRGAVAAGLLLVGLIVVSGGVVSSAGAAQPAIASYRLEARYDVRVHLDWDTRVVKVRTMLDVLNTSGGPVDKLELNSAAVKLGSMRDLRVRVNGSPVRPRVIGQTIKVPLGESLAAAASVKVELAFRARLRTRSGGRSYYFARLAGVAQLYRFIPWLSRAIRFGTQEHGEPFLTPNSPWVRVSVSADRPLVWATSGRQVARAGRRRATFLATDVRDFVIAASPGYRTVRGRSRDGDTRILAFTQRSDGRRLVELARKELARYERLTGVPYPHATYSIAKSGGGLPMEAPGLTWIPAARSAAEQPFLVSHETAHQWWYAIVGNDQSTDAFADEALADYFARRAHLSIRASRCPRDRLDRDIRGYSSACYFEVIYIQGARFLEGLRRDFGGRAFRRAIRAYTAGNQGGIGSNVRLLEAFRAEMGDGVLKRFHARFPSLY